MVLYVRCYFDAVYAQDHLPLLARRGKSRCFSVGLGIKTVVKYIKEAAHTKDIF